MTTKPICIRSRCTARAKKRGYCQRHYEKGWRVGLIPVIARSIDPTTVRERITEHLDRGRSVSNLAKAAGVAACSLRKVYLEGTPIRATTAKRVMSVPLPPSEVGIQRRLQALERIGYSMAEFARASGIPIGTLQDGFFRSVLTARLRLRIADAYERLSATPFDAPRTVTRALKQGYHAPADWEYLDIDDALAHPVQVGPGEALTHEQYVDLLISGELPRGVPRLARVQAVAYLTDRKGWCAEEIAVWLRMDRRTVTRMRAETRGERPAPGGPRQKALHCRGEAKHPFTPENTRFDKNGKRHCVECETIYKQTHKRSGRGDRRTTVKIAA